MTRTVFARMLSLFCVAGISLAGQRVNADEPSPAQRAVHAAAQEHQHAFILFYRVNDAAKQGMQRVLQRALALGASQGFVTRMFLGKATLLGVAGGGGGFVIGTLLAYVLGPQLLGVNVQPMLPLCGIGIATATLVAVAASYLPARRAAGLDPCLVFNDA